MNLLLVLPLLVPLATAAATILLARSPRATRAASFAGAAAFLAAESGPDDIVLVMGARDNSLSDWARGLCAK